MINNTVLLTMTFYYPLGEAPQVSLTQDLPLEQDADILLLGCGDARTILFTCFADSARKIDVTCCDTEPGIHARNILLYTLLIDDEADLNVERIWNIYHHWKIDKDSLELLETQTQKLLKLSESIDQWNDSVYGSCIRFCDARSLTSVRRYWSGYTTQNLSPAQKKDRVNQMQAMINRAKEYRNTRSEAKGIDFAGLRATFPVINPEAILDVTKVCNQWWDSGTTLPSGASKLTDLNPTFCYTPNKGLLLHYGISPIHGIPLSTAYTPITKVFSKENKNLSSIERLIKCAKDQFVIWASAFRKAVANKSVIRFFTGDALNFCLALRNCQLTQSTSMNWFSDAWTSTPLNLHSSDYGHKNNPAPVSFDVIDTSTLAEHFGAISYMAVGSSLLKQHASSSLYTKTVIHYDSNLADRLTNFFGVDVRTMSLLLGLVPPNLFTNASITTETDLLISELVNKSKSKQSWVNSARSRLRWKKVLKSGTSCDSPFLTMEYKALAQFLSKVHNQMFKHEEPDEMMSLFKSFKMSDTTVQMTQLAKFSYPPYNRASFAFLLSILKENIVTNWNECVELIYNQAFTNNSLASLKLNSAQDLNLQMHLFGVDNGKFVKAREIPNEARAVAILAPAFPAGDLPDQLCVTIRVKREKLRFLAQKKPGESGCPAMICTFESSNPYGIPWLNYFSCIQLVFGEWHDKTKGGVSCPYIEEDSAQLYGFSDMFASVMVPTPMLLQEQRFVPTAKCGLMLTAQNVKCYQQLLGHDLAFARYKMTDKNVFITRFMPGITALPTLSPPGGKENKSAPITTTVRLNYDASKIDTLMRRALFLPWLDKNKPTVKSSDISVKSKSPLTCVTSLAGSPGPKIEFPIPVSVLKSNVKVTKTKSFIDVESRLFDPLEEEAGFFMLPTLLTQTPNGTNVPTLWTSSRVDLDTMPQLDLSNKQAISWLNNYVGQMFTARELNIRNAKAEDIRTELKDGFFSLFMNFAGLGTQKVNIFGITKEDSSIQSLIFPACLRLDLVNNTIVLDCALIPPNLARLEDPKVREFLQELFTIGVCGIKVSDDENRAWKSLMPALVERCRTWNHTRHCEYIRAGEIPLPGSMKKDTESPICSCGTGKFPHGDYLKDQKLRLADFSYLLKEYGTRVGISPIFGDVCVEDRLSIDSMLNQDNGNGNNASQSGEHCGNCGRGKRKNAGNGPQHLFVCSGCKVAKYCSIDCQKADRKSHKPFCK